MKNIAIIAPSGCVENLEGLLNAKKILEKNGMAVKIYPSCYEKFRYMAGDDSLRLKDLHNAFSDKNIDTIICARGGYGAIRLLDKIDWEIIKKSRAKFIGSSDITALLVGIYKNTGKITYHAKMAANGISKMDTAEFLKYKNAIENDIYKLPGDFSAIGTLWGGNLATIVSLFGAKPESYIPDEDIILFLEDINEPDYKIDRMLTQILRNKPLCKRISGVIFGEFIGSGEFIKEIQKEFAAALDVPYAHDKKITHGENNTVVPVGLRV